MQKASGPEVGDKLFQVEYKYSACIVIKTQDVSILCDPWFDDCAYYGTWSRYPRHEITHDFIGDFDLVWISHIHPDHYSPISLRALFDIAGEKRISIADWGEQKNYLQLKLISDGFGHLVDINSEKRIGSTTLKCFPNKTGSSSDIDSALLVYDIDSRKSILNINDCIVNDYFTRNIIGTICERDLVLEGLCLGYTGAGPYPQTYYSPRKDRETLTVLANKKKDEFFDRYKRTKDALPSRWRLPFAGKYLLANELACLNPYRGVADALEVKEYDPQAIVLDDSGKAYINVIEGTASCERCESYNEAGITPVNEEFLWRKLVPFEPEVNLLKRLAIASFKNAHSKSEVTIDCALRIHTYKSDESYEAVAENPEEYSMLVAECNCNKDVCLADHIDNAVVIYDIYIEGKALFAALTGLCHWNNYEVGSIFISRRTPDVFVREIHSFLNFCSVC